MLEIVTFLAGAAVMVLEMTGARLMAPHLGSSIVVWTAIIGVILASLSLGYWLGGKASDKNPSRHKLGLLLFCAGCCVLVVAIGHFSILSFITGYGFSLQIAAPLAAMTLFAPPAVLLGMISPYVIKVALENRQTPPEKAGSLIGRFFAVSSLGSILGTFLGGYILISWFGSGAIIYMVSGALMLASGLSIAGSAPARLVLPAAGLCLSFILAVQSANAQKEQSLTGNFSLDTLYSNMHITTFKNTNNEAVRYLSTDPHMVHSGMYIEKPEALLLHYTRYYSIAWRLRPDARNFLMLGGGGYSVPKYLLSSRPELHLDVVEIDQGMTEIAKECFALKANPRMQIWHEDARMFLNRFSDQAKDSANGLPAAGYDIIMGDTFGSAYNIPFHLGTIECAKLIHGALNTDGVYISNIISAVEGDSGRLLRSIYGAFAQVFPQVHIFPLTREDGSGMQNIMLLAMKNPEKLPDTHALALQLQDNSLYIGNATPEAARAEAGTAFMALSKEWRKPIIADVPPLCDDFAPVERYTMPLLQAIYR